MQNCMGLALYLQLDHLFLSTHVWVRSRIVSTAGWSFFHFDEGARGLWYKLSISSSVESDASYLDLTNQPTPMLNSELSYASISMLVCVYETHPEFSRASYCQFSSSHILLSILCWKPCCLILFRSQWQQVLRFLLHPGFALISQWQILQDLPRWDFFVPIKYEYCLNLNFYQLTDAADLLKENHFIPVLQLWRSHQSKGGALSLFLLGMC